MARRMSLPLALGDVADGAMKAGEQRPDRHHPHAQRGLLNAVAGALEHLDRLDEIAYQDLGRFVAGRRLLQPSADLRQTRLADG